MLVNVELPSSVPGLRAVRTTTDELFGGMKDYFAVARTERGWLEYWSNGRVQEAGPGSVLVKQPGDVHRDVRRDGPMTFTVVHLPKDDVARARAEGGAVTFPQLDPGDARAATIHRLHDAIDARASRLAIEVALAEVVSTLAAIREPSHHSRPVRRAMDYLREHLVQTVTLDALAEHADLDKFHLCRAFRAQVGLPPHAYLTRLRIARAKQLLARGLRASEIASRVGFYDQAQLGRHFRRITGTTPAAFAREATRISG